MNRNEEYDMLVQEMEEKIPELDHSVEKARKRRFRKWLITRPLTGFATVFALFVILVNFSTPVAFACAQIPVLRELAEAVTFSRSLSDAVENEFVQTMEETQAGEEVTASIEYVIADKKQMYIFFRLDSDVYSRMGVKGFVEAKRGESVLLSTWCEWPRPEELEGGLWMLSQEFRGDITPTQVSLTLYVYEDSGAEHPYFWQKEEENHEYIAEFVFDLDLDQEQIKAGKVIEVDRTLELDGQRYTVSSIEVYPTCLCVNLTEASGNTAWLSRLVCYVETDSGMQFEWNGNGSGGPYTQSMLTIQMDSPYFYEAESLKLVVTGANFIDKEDHVIRLDLANGRAENLPESMELVSMEKQDGDWLVKMKVDYTEHTGTDTIFDFWYTDGEGTKYTLQAQGEDGDPNADGEVTYLLYTMRLHDYSQEEAFVTYSYKYKWILEEPIVIPVQ